MLIFPPVTLPATDISPADKIFPLALTGLVTVTVPVPLAVNVKLLLAVRLVMLSTPIELANCIALPSLLVILF